MPNQMMKSGARITRGMAFRRIITGSSTSASGGTIAAPKPSTAPSDEPADEPEQRRREGRGDMLPDRAVGEELDSVAATALGGGA